jgi:hypothetical protein
VSDVPPVLGREVSSLQRRITAMHRLWQLALADMTLEQVNHCERPGVLPISFSLLHFVRGEDNNISSLLLGEPTLWEQGGWAARVGVTVDAVPRGTPLAVAEQLRFSDLDAWRAYQHAVFERTERVLATLTNDDYLRVLYGGELPAAFHGAFISFVVDAEGPVRVVDALECFVYQHGIRHLGELEHGRALVGLGGLT